MIAKLTATRWCVRELIWVRDLASPHKIEQMRRVRTLGKQADSKREGGFDRIKIKAEMDEQTLRRLNSGFGSEPLYTGVYSPRWPPTPKYFAHERRGRDIEVENSTFFVVTAAAALRFIAATAACGRYGVGRTRSAAY